jgi:tol-pal system-associated acyl-CoA thioesterase
MPPLLKFPVKVYLEDTDAQGIVYHANYLKFMERARNEYLEHLGFSLANTYNIGIFFVVFEMKLKFRKPAKLNEMLEVRTSAVKGSEYRLTFTQEIYRGDETTPLLASQVIIVTIDTNGELCPLPTGLEALEPEDG